MKGGLVKMKRTLVVRGSNNKGKSGGHASQPVDIS
jgi:hypothetical protein